MKSINYLMIIIIALLFTSCAETVVIQECVINEPSGFWSGLWHGMISPFAFIGHLINNDIAVYDVNNTGAWYDFGFLLGVGSFSTSTTTAAVKK